MKDHKEEIKRENKKQYMNKHILKNQHIAFIVYNLLKWGMNDEANIMVIDTYNVNVLHE